MPPAPSARGGAVTPPSKPQSPLRITHDGEFYARLLTKESSSLGTGTPSFRYYGAGPGAVPFVWESQPGTPKDAYSSSSRMCAAVAPVITPPPSYHYHLRGAPPLSRHGSRRRHGKASTSSGKYFGYKQLKWIKVGFIATVFRRLAFGKSSSAAASVKSSSSSTRWLFSGSNAGEVRDQEVYYDEPATPAKRVLCLGGIRPSPWMLQLCSREREQSGWVYGWRP